METALELIRGNPGGWTLVILVVASALEYLVPPFPADLLIVAGALLVIAGQWSFPAVLAAVVGGGFLGSAISYWIGHLLVDARGSLRGGRLLERLTGRGSIDRFFEAFRKYGLWVIAINRALPGIRAATFLAAGAARLPIMKTLLLGLVSSVLWSSALLTLGVLLGDNWEKIEQVLGVYQTVGFGLLAAIGLLAWRLRRRRPQTP